MIRKLPPASEDIIFLLAKHASLTLEEIMDTIGDTSEKTLRYAMRRLLENGIVKRIPNLLDMRSVSYRLASPDEIADVLHELSDHIAEKILAAVEKGTDRAFV